MTIILFLLVLALLIFVHELGHFAVAKWSGVAVEEFGLGFPPRLFKIKKGETVYSLNLIPFGGFVKLLGEDGNEVVNPKSLAAKSRPKQAAVMAAGVVANIILAWILLSLALYLGLPASVETAPPGAVVEHPALTITAVKAGGPAAVANLKPGDVILELVNQTATLKAPTTNQAINFIKNTRVGILTLTYQPKGETVLKKINLTPEVGLLEPGVPALGVSFEVLGLVKLPLSSAFTEGALFTGRIIKATVVGLGQIIGQALTGQKNLLTAFVGPVGLAGMVGEANDFGFSYLLSFIAFISINLAIFNLLPLPALDGGRLLILLVEGISRRTLPTKFTVWYNLTGLALIILLMVVITYADLTRLF
ncbi:MAG: site-2 protease family protein [bacterium]|nr:site-2 protease family protein [bacterium]